MDASLRAWYGLNEVMGTGYSAAAAVGNMAFVHAPYYVTGLEKELMFFSGKKQDESL